LSRRRNAGKLFASVTEVGRLFHIADTAELKARLLYAVYMLDELLLIFNDFVVSVTF